MTTEQEKAFLLRWIKELEEKLYTVRSLKAGAETGFGKIMQDNIKQKIDYLKQEYENCEYLEKIWKAVVDDKELLPEKDEVFTYHEKVTPLGHEICSECAICPYIYIKE
ncbi:MAG: hypothetical protein J6W13_07620 [Salinivirgaceae bacterium]|nr:hypothetical protein [Salinivirgaceae bacterium]